MIHRTQKKTLSKKHIKTFWLVSLMFFGLLVIMVTINGAMIWTQQAKILNPDNALLTRADCVLILGAGITDDHQPSLMLKDRLDKGIELARKDPDLVLLMSGDHGTSNHDEVNVMKTYAIKQGIASERIFMDHAGFSTYDSIVRAKLIFGAKSVIIVSQRDHLIRALYLAQQYNLEAVGVTAREVRYGGQSIRDVREFAAKVKDFLYGLVQPHTTVLGDPISLKESGDLTNDK